MMTAANFNDKNPIIKTQFKTSHWSGGTTTELFIYPSNSSYQERNFAFRLSTATVNFDESEFTSLPNVSRKTMMLNGNIELTHHNQYSKKLSPFEVDEFKGDWKTTCKGTCIDFNLMTTRNTSGNIEAITLNKNDMHTYHPTKTCNWLVLYLYSGEVTLHLNDTNYLLSKGNLFILKDNMYNNIELKGNQNSQLIFSNINTEL
jgi:uncharacterized protein